MQELGVLGAVRRRGTPAWIDLSLQQLRTHALGGNCLAEVIADDGCPQVGLRFDLDVAHLLAGTLEYAFRILHPGAMMESKIDVLRVHSDIHDLILHPLRESVVQCEYVDIEDAFVRRRQNLQH